MPPYAIKKVAEKLPDFFSPFKKSYMIDMGFYYYSKSFLKIIALFSVGLKTKVSPDVSQGILSRKKFCFKTALSSLSLLPSFFLKKKKKKFICLATPGLSCSTRDL